MTVPRLMNCNHSETGWCIDCVNELHDEKESLLNAIIHLRKHQRTVVTTRYLAEMLGVSPSQLSEWTADPITTPPDIVCRRTDIDERCGCKVTNGYRCQVHGDP